MICSVCKKPFTPNKNESVCLDCAKAAWLAKQPPINIIKEIPIYKERRVSEEICKVEWIKNNTLYLFIRQIPDYAVNKTKYIYNSFAEGDSKNVQIISNFKDGTQEIKLYTFEKLPAFVDSVTGTDKIVIPEEKIEKIINNTIYLVNGDYIRVQFRNRVPTAP